MHPLKNSGLSKKPMDFLYRFVLFIRWPVALGLIVALSLMVFFQQQTPQPQPINIPAQNTPNTSGPASYADAVKRASLSVVNIYSRKEVEQRLHPLFRDPIFRQMFNSADRPRQRRMQSILGSGVLVTNEGHILTNHHVIGGADEIVVALEDGRNAQAKVLGENIERDLAVLKIELDNLQPIEVSGTEPEVGDVVLAIGNPFGVGQTVTLGIISANSSRNRALNISAFEDFIQTDAAIHPGSSGGALINVHGDLIGINTANLAQNGAGGIGFAVPAEIAMQTLDDIIRFGRVVRGWLGVVAKPIAPRSVQDVGLQSAIGVLISEITPGGPAEAAGLQRGDIIIGIRGKPVSNAGDIVQAVKESRPGETVTIEFIRGGKAASLAVVLGEQPLGG